MSKDFAALLVGRILQIALSFISIRVFTSLLSPSEVGEYYVIFTLISFSSQTLINPVGLFLNRHLNLWTHEGKTLDCFFIYGIYLLGVAIVSAIAAICLQFYAEVGANLSPSYFGTSIALVLFFLTFSQTIVGSLNMLSHRVMFVVFSVLTQIFTLTFSILFVKYIDTSAFSYIFGQVVSLIIMSAVSLVFFSKVTASKFNIRRVFSYIKKRAFLDILNFCLPLVVSSACIWLQYQSYRLIVEQYVSLEFLGFLGLGFGIAASIYAAAETLIHQLYLPIYYRGINTDSSSERAKAWNSMAYLLFPLFLATALLVSALAPFLMMVFASSTYADAWQYVIFGVWIEFFRSITNTLSSVAHSEMKTRYLVKSYAFGGVFAAASSYYLSVTGLHYFIPFVLTLSGFLTLVVMYLEMKNMMTIDVGVRRLLSTVYLALPLALSLFLFDLRHSFFYSFAVCLVFSVYMLATQYKNAKMLIREV